MKKIFYAVLVVMMVTMFGCSQNTSGNLEQSNDKTQIKLQTSKPLPKNTDNETETNNLNKNDIKVVDEYYMENSIGDTEYYLVIKNESNQTVAVESSAIALNKAGEEIGAADGEIEDLPSKCESIISFYFSSTKDVSKFKYNLNINQEEYYKPAIQNIHVTSKVMKDKVIVKCKNNGTDDVEFLQAYVLFFKGKKLVGSDSAYFTNDDSVIPAKETITKQIESYEKFDSVKIYLSGRKE